jgi:small subunit ribosomal protein S16
MLKIKLSRAGKTHEPRFRIVVVEAKSKRDGKYTEKLGHYNPINKELVFDLQKFESWKQKGAQPTLTVANLAKRLKTNEKPA